MSSNYKSFIAQAVDCGLRDQIEGNCKLSDCTTYKIGGPAKLFATPTSINSLKKIIEASKNNNIKYIVIGGGSNILASDDGFDGLCINLSQGFSLLEYNSEEYTVGAGCKLAKLVADCKKHNRSCFEFAVGTPGTIGGALKMNAGTKDDWIGSRVKSVKALDLLGNCIDISGDEINWEYRKTSFSEDSVILSAKFIVKQLYDKTEIKEMHKKIDNKLSTRKRIQPLNFPSCGSVFKNPKGFFAGKLIDDAGLKGKTCGAAQISEKHANFIINRGGASAKDVIQLINLIQKRVFDNSGVKLKPEVKFLGFDCKPCVF